MEFLAVLWGVVIGAVFSTVGAAGGILAGFGHITLFGLQSANTVKVMNQLLVVLSPLISVPTYKRQGRLILSLGVLLGLGSLVGAFVGSELSYRYLSGLKEYKFLFGLFTLLVALKILHEVLRRERKKVEKIDEGIKKSRSRSVTVKNRSLKRIEFEFLEERYAFNPLYPFVAGFFVAVLSSALGVGGGFLLVPFMVSVLKIPMYLVPGTSALAVLITSFISVSNYLRLGVEVHWNLVLLEGIGVVLGSFLGPHISHLLGERRLRILLGIVLFAIGLRYVL